MFGNHRHHSHYSLAKWRKSVLWPCWVVQSAILLALMGLFSYRLSQTLTSWKAEQDRGDIPTVQFVWEAANIGFSLFCFLITLMSIARFVAEALTPTSMLFGSLVSFVLSGAILGLDIVVYIQRPDKHYTLIGLALDCALMLLSIALAIYSILVYRRVSQYDDYHLPYNVKGYGYDNREQASYPSHLAPTQPYDPVDPTTGGGRGRSLSAVSAGSRRLSFGSRRESTSSVQLQPVPDMPRRPSYDHKRDTSFDEYRARRTSSAGFSKEEVDHALGVEFGWGDERRPDGVVNAGNINAAHLTTRPRGNSNPGPLQRHSSYEATIDMPTDNSAASIHTTSPSELSRAHSLVCVPEHPEEDLGVPRVSRHSSYTPSYRTRASEDREGSMAPYYYRPATP